MIKSLKNFQRTCKNIEIDPGRHPMEWIRKEPSFSLCGLNCCLCPRYHTHGDSKCPGCGGPNFLNKHPVCAIATCNKKHDHVEFCFDCSQYPCGRYMQPSQADSFITYQNARQDMADAKENLDFYLKRLKEKQRILEELLNHYNDGRSKGFYCLAVNLLPLEVLKSIVSESKKKINESHSNEKMQGKEMIELMLKKANELNIELVLRKTNG